MSAFPALKRKSAGARKGIWAKEPCLSKRPAAKSFPAAYAAGQTLFAAENINPEKFARAVSQREQIPEIAGTQAAERFRPPEQKKFASRDAGGRRGIRAARGSCFLSKCGNIRGAWERVKRFMHGGTAGGSVRGTWGRGLFHIKKEYPRCAWKRWCPCGRPVGCAAGKGHILRHGAEYQGHSAGAAPSSISCSAQTAQKPIGFWNWIPERCFAPEKGLA